MKKSMKIISAAMCALMILSAGTTSVCARSERTDSVASEENSEAYDAAKLRDFVSASLDTVNINSADTISGEISLLEPFIIPEYLPRDGEYYYDETGNAVMFPVVCDGNVIALVSSARDKKTDPEYSFIMLTENAERNLRDGVSFFVSEYMTPSERRITYYGKTYVETKFFSVDGSNNISFDFYRIIRAYPAKGDPYELRNTAAVLFNKPTFEKLSEYCCVDENTEVLFSFDYDYSGSKNIVSGEKYYIRNKYGKYLAYDGGKYFLSDDPDSEFILTRKKNGSFSISPASNPKKRMSVNGTGTFYINLSDYEGFCYSICRSDAPGSMLTASGNKAEFTDNDPEKISVSLKDWYIIRA